MPNRILRDWTDSEKFDGLSPGAERLFVRLIMKADDYGRFHATPKLVASACFPLGSGVDQKGVADWLHELEDKRLVFLYDCGSRRYAAIVNFRQRLKRSVPKFPPAPGKDRNWLPDDSEFPDVPGTSRMFPELPAGDGVGYGDGNGDGVGTRTQGSPPRISLEKAVDYLTSEDLDPKPTPPYSLAEIRKAWLSLNANGWMWGQRPVSDPFSAISTKIEDNRERNPQKQERPSGPNI